ncbi:MAG TPA: hypothetical protein VLL54_15870 [Pyrinomonadaceae bacterium]|nr:hypothetical protein [Pyrinomonadaceae bacterium]
MKINLVTGLIHRSLTLLTTKRVVVLLLLLLVPSLRLAAQTADEKLSPADEQEVRRFVKSFSDQILRTRDLSPLLQMPSARPALDVAFADSDLLAQELRPKMKPQELRRFQIALINLSFLSSLYVYGNVDITNGSFQRLDYRQQYPAAVYRYLKQNPNVSNMWTIESGADPISDPVKVRGVTATFERGATMLRGYLRAHPPERSPMYQKNLAWVMPRLKEMRVETCTTIEKCAPYPAHSQFVTVQLPVLQLSLVKSNGKLGIMTIGILEDSW